MTQYSVSSPSYLVTVSRALCNGYHAVQPGKCKIKYRVLKMTDLLGCPINCLLAHCNARSSFFQGQISTWDNRPLTFPNRPTMFSTLLCIQRATWLEFASGPALLSLICSYDTVRIELAVCQARNE